MSVLVTIEETMALMADRLKTITPSSDEQPARQEIESLSNAILELSKAHKILALESYHDIT
jgi:hypothetical protein